MDSQTWKRVDSTVGWLLSFDPDINKVINLIINTLPVSSWFSYNHLITYLILKYQNAITYLDDLVIIQVGYQSLNT